MNLKRLAEISPLIGAFLVFVGYLKLHVYYSHWEIEISSYLDFSEIVLSFLKDTHIILFFILMILIQMVFGALTLKSVDDKLKSEHNPNQIEEKANSSEQFQGILPLIEEFIDKEFRKVILVFFTLTIVFVALFLVFPNLIWLYCSFVVFIQLLHLFLDRILGIKDEKALIQTAFVLVIFGFSLCLAKYDIRQTENSSTNVCLETDLGISFCSDCNLIYLGKTNNYHFLYDNQKHHSVVISESSVKKTVLGN